MRSDDGNIGSHTYFWYDSGCCACVDEGQPHKSGIQTGTAVHLDLERNPTDGAAFLIYFGLPNLGITFSAMTAGVLSMSLNTGAYIAEIVRSGIHAIDPGQREAAKALGMPWHLEMLRIVAPQATKICILPLVNQFIATIKNTSILSAITLTELTREGTLIAYNSFHYFEPYIAVAVLYLILTTIFTQIAGVLERRMA